MSKTEFYKLVTAKLGCEVLGIKLQSENRPEVIKQIKQDVTRHKLLIFREQGVINGDRHVEISKWFGDLESTFYKHPKSPHPDVFRVSNDSSEGCTGVGRTGWHIDGSFQPAPFGYSLYHMVSVPKDGATVFVPLTELIESLPKDKFEEWNRLWMLSDRRSGPIHPLIYKHPLTNKLTLCFHLGMTSDYIYDFGTATERIATDEEFKRIQRDIHDEIEKENRRLVYKHEWQVGDFIISDNLAVGHEAAPETQISRDKVGLRVLHRTTIKGIHPPKNFK